MTTRKAHFNIGDKIDWIDPSWNHVTSPQCSYGPGPFQVEEIKEVPDLDIGAVGHGQWLIVSKEIDGQKLLYDSWKKCWVLPPIPDWPTPHQTISGAYFKLI